MRTLKEYSKEVSKIQKIMSIFLYVAACSLGMYRYGENTFFVFVIMVSLGVAIIAFFVALYQRLLVAALYSVDLFDQEAVKMKLLENHS